MIFRRLTGAYRASCPLRSSGVVSLLEVEVSDALIGVGQKSPFCNMLVLSPYIRACARTRQTDRQTDTHTHTRMCVSVRVCTCVSVCRLDWALQSWLITTSCHRISQRWPPSVTVMRVNLSLSCQFHFLHEEAQLPPHPPHSWSWALNIMVCFHDELPVPAELTIF